ncbi:DUF11 domain-containing protein [Methylobacterium oryzihabitans]|uniref:DUF11 domain-containing protein n=2 Tax=Methylobacterium oryzihabitans TaxID=2499852 RepID=A0A3S2V5G2_9HYPH|nr:DUF11 domain-containing protein [Methylobacterium oryzihabitans]
MFLQGSGTLTYAPGAGQTSNLYGTIEDQVGYVGRTGYVPNAGTWTGTERWTLAKDGAGTLKMWSANTHSGGTTISDGTLWISHLDAGGTFDGLGGGTVTLDGGTLELAASGSLVRNDLVVAPNRTGGIAVSAGETAYFQFTAASSLSLGAGSRIVFGSQTATGTLAFQTDFRSIDASASLEVGGGTLRDESGLLQNRFLALLSETRVGANAALDLNGNSGTIRNLQGAAASAVLRTGTDAATVTTIYGGSFAGAIQGAGGLAKTRGDTLALSGDSSYAGGTALDGGVLALGRMTSAGSGGITFGSGAQILRLDAGGTLANALLGFDVDDAIDLRAIRAGGATLTRNGDSLTVTEGAADGGDSNTLSLGPAPVGYAFALSDDGSGGTRVRLAQDVADLSVTLSNGGGALQAGADTTYTLTVSNTGLVDAADVTVTNVLPANATFVSLTQTGGPAFATTTPAEGANGPIRGTLASLAVGATATFALTLRTDASSPTLTNTVTVRTATAEVTTGNNTATDSDAVDTTPPTVSLATTGLSRAEGNGGTTVYDFTLTRTGNLNLASDVGYAVTGAGTNPADAADFAGGVLPTGRVVFAAGSSTATITLRVAGDASVERDESFVLTLSDPRNATIGTGTATGLITDDDSAPADPSDPTGASRTGTAGDDSLFGGAGNDTLSGLAGNDRLTGRAGDDRLDGGVGADTMLGGLGDDTYLVDDLRDVVTELFGEGRDTVLTSLSAYALGDAVEALTATGSGFFTGTGNALANLITGGNRGNRLDGGAGADTLVGGLGNDTYVVDDVNDVVVERAGGGIDRVLVGVSYTLGDNVENLGMGTSASLSGTGNALANQLVGNRGNNVLDGRGGADTLVGGLGDDTYVVDNAGDVVTELAGEGFDTVRTSLSAYTLCAAVEALTATSTGSFTGTGNALANLITGSDRGNRLDGGAGADTLVGGLGNDTYVVDNAADVVVERAGGGTDRVLTNVSYTLGDNVENLGMGTSLGLSGTGNALANLLVGNKGNNVLDGRGGADTLTGGAGRDTFVLRAGETAGDTVTDFVRGTDTLAFYGFGTGAMLSRGSGDLYTVTSADGSTSGSFRLTGVADLDLSAGAGNTDARFFA